MYMCRETIRRSVVQKFNDTKGWDCKDLDDLYDKIEDRQEANEIVNSLKICDPAVGSGHFLVSALNEMIAIKNDLKIFQDRDGKRLKEYVLEVVNDELVITDDDGELFEYSIHNKESQRLQETLFHEKQTIIENCLFGVDINPNSVKICRLRLWIELLKSAYYKTQPSTNQITSSNLVSQYGELETLPNIDINIKCGNSLISRFDLDADIHEALKKRTGAASRWTIDSYRIAVDAYRNAQSKEEKHEMERLINDIKSDFRSEISKNDPKQKKLYKFNGELANLTTQTSMFEMSKKEKTAWNKKVEKLTKDTKKLETEIEEIKNNKIYENAFEWRFEFPEVLNDEGDFVGFDTVIGNPPYIRQEELKEIKPYLERRFSTFAGTADLFVYFVELGMRNLKADGNFTFIIPNKWMRAGYGKALRNFIQKQQIQSILDFGDLPVFEEATTYPCILSMSKSEAFETFPAANIETLQFTTGLKNYVIQNKLEVLACELPDAGWTLTDSKIQKLLSKLRDSGIPLSEYSDGKIFYGIKTGLNEAFIIDKETRDALIKEDEKSIEVIKPFLDGKDIKRYQSPIAKKYLILFKNGDTKTWFGELEEPKAWDYLENKYPAICNFLAQFKDKGKSRSDQGNYWWELRPCDYYSAFEGEKIVWAETSLGNQLCLINSGVYLNKTSFMIPSCDQFLLGVMNSRLVRFFLGAIVSKVRGGYFSMSKAYVETTPITGYSQEIESKVAHIIAVKKENSKEDTTALEAEIDQLVYELYGLTEEEIAIVEQATNN